MLGLVDTLSSEEPVTTNAVARTFSHITKEQVRLIKEADRQGGRDHAALVEAARHAGKE